MSANCEVNVIFPTQEQFGAIRKLDSKCMVYNTYIFINRNLLFYKNWKQKWKISTTAFILLILVNVLTIFAKNTTLLQKMLTSTKLRGSWYKKVCFLKLHTKFQVSSITLTSFRRGNFTSHATKQTLKSPPRLGFTGKYDRTWHNSIQKSNYWWKPKLTFKD